MPTAREDTTTVRVEEAALGQLVRRGRYGWRFSAIAGITRDVDQTTITLENGDEIVARPSELVTIGTFEEDVFACAECACVTPYPTYVADGEANYCEECAEEFPACPNPDCGERYTTERRASRCCPTYECPQCGAAHYEERDAVECCPTYDCPQCESTYYDAGAAMSCCPGRVYAWSHKPRPHLHGTDSPAWYGVEIEIESVSADRAELADAIADTPDEDDYYLKDDGSLENGVELVTHPRTLASWHAWKPTLGARLKTAADMGARAWDAPGGTAGLHVHITRAAFRGDSHIYRFTKLVEDNGGQLARFAGRNSERWASFDKDKRRVKRVDAIKNHRGERYQAVNLLNAHTIELRFFRPSLKIDSVLAAVELSDAMRVYTERMSTRDVVDGALTFENLARFVTHDPRYPHALAKIRQRCAPALPGLEPTPEEVAE